MCTDAHVTEEDRESQSELNVCVWTVFLGFHIGDTEHKVITYKLISQVILHNF